MTRLEVAKAMAVIINNRNATTAMKVNSIFAVMGKLAPEPKPKPELPKYDEKLVRRVGTILQRIKFDADDHAAARRLIVELGLE